MKTGEQSDLIIARLGKTDMADHQKEKDEKQAHSGKVADARLPRFPVPEIIGVFLAFLCSMTMLIRVFSIIAMLLASATTNAQVPATVAPELPAINQRIVDHVLAQEGKKVGRGECWDLAADALNTAGAKWDGMYKYGEVVDWRKNEVLPGDIVQMADVQVEHKEGNMSRREFYGKHTAVVIAVHGRGDISLAHQNVDPVGKKVGFSELNLEDVRTGKLVFYRPQE